MSSEKFRKFSFRWAQDFFYWAFKSRVNFVQSWEPYKINKEKPRRRFCLMKHFFLFCLGVICFPFIYYVFNMLTLHYILLPRFPHNLKMWILLSIFIVSQLFPPLSIFTVNLYVGVPTLESIFQTLNY